MRPGRHTTIVSADRGARARLGSLGRAGAVVLAGVLALPLLVRAGEIPETMPASEIPNNVRASPGLATAGQPAPETLARLKELGFKTVINIRTEAEPGVVQEADVVKAQGLDYHLIPITAATFSAEQVDAIAKILDDPAAGPVLFHCGSSNRVGAVIAAIEARKGRGCAEAEAEGRRLGLRSESMVEAARRVGNCAQP
jgi:uncharacterized protein (TIGR01244 family)